MAEWAAATAQLLEPARQPLHGRRGGRRKCGGGPVLRARVLRARARVGFCGEAMRDWCCLAGFARWGRGGRLGRGVAGWGVVAPGAYGVEVGNEVGREAGGEGFAVELGGEVGGEILGHDEGNEQGVAGLPGFGGVVEDVELDGQGVGSVDAVVALCE